MTNQSKESVLTLAVSSRNDVSWQLGLTVLVAVGSFYIASISAEAGLMMIFYVLALLQLSAASTWRRAFYSGLVVGLLIGATRLTFFWGIFSAGALALWLVYAFWIALFVAKARLCRNRFPGAWGLLPIPFLWCGIEYFRSELYYLRFSWLSPGFAFAATPAAVPISCVGVYGIGFLFMTIACAAVCVWQRSKVLGLLTITVGLILLRLAPSIHRDAPAKTMPLKIAGVQMEFPTESEVLLQLTQLVRRNPAAELLVLSEYTFDGPIPASITNWCRNHQRFVVLGGKDPTVKSNFYNTAFVISPSGDTTFRQVKSIPIQFFRDGLPAPEQRVWDSPWGKLGFCICYDLSYSRVTDRLIKQGAQALIVPTMDVIDWGEAEHKLHARVAPLRAAEYGVPIFRLASSGISQAVDRNGHVLATAPFPGDGVVLASTLDLPGAGRLPWDRYLAPISTGLTAILGLLFTIEQILGRTIGSRRIPQTASPQQCED